jgi:hypothetical protein
VQHEHYTPCPTQTPLESSLNFSKSIQIDWYQRGSPVPAPLRRALSEPAKLRLVNNAKDSSMHSDLRAFLARYIGVVLLALAPVVFTAFVSMPLSMNRHPGETAQVDAPLRHMT